MGARLFVAPLPASKLFNRLIKEVRIRMEMIFKDGDVMDDNDDFEYDDDVDDEDDDNLGLRAQM